MAPTPNAEHGRLAYWRIMTGLQTHYGEFTSRVVVDLAGVGHRKTIENYLAFLVAEKVVRIVDSHSAGAKVTNVYRIVNLGEAPPMRRGDSSLGQRQQAMWTAIRSLGTFRVPELAEAAATDEVIPRETAAGYVADLLRAGYLSVAGHAPESRRFTLYRLLPARNTGPRAPIVMRSERACFDLNIMRLVNLNQPEAAGRAA
jgi:hypothetical protein